MSTADIVHAHAGKTRKPGLISVLRRNVPLSIGLGILWLVAMVLVAIFADLLRPYGITAMDLSNRLAAPGNAKH
ncbi:MAG: ABC transporter permease, partial [Rhizobium sp.]|nr:ABC transporter permease [Rhizobium sp.]